MGETAPIPIICGPTASGKTGAVVTLARAYPIEVISADSRQIIRHLSIGTSKPTPDEYHAVEFHLVDIIDPGERYSAYRFIDDAGRSIRAILKRGHIPVVVGGTGLYLRALSEGVVEIEQDDLAVRERLEQEMDRLGAVAMFERLEQIDPLEAASLHPNNKVRVIRALEIFERTGKTRSELAVSGAYHKCDYNFDSYCLAPPREQLYERIDQRVGEMLAAGWLDELTALIEAGWGDAIRQSFVIGYCELLDHLDGKCSLDEATELIKQNTRRYAKRQMTWFRHQGECEFFENGDDLVEVLERELSKFTGV